MSAAALLRVSRASAVVPIVLAAALVAAGWWLWHDGYRTGHASAESAGARSIAELQAEHAIERAAGFAAALESAKSAAKSVREEQQRADMLATSLAQQRREYRATTDQLTSEIARVNDLYRSARDAAPEPMPAGVVSRGWVRVYDAATGAAGDTRADAGGDPGRAAAPAAVAAAARRVDDSLDSGLRLRDILGHHIAYAEQCRASAAQLNALIDYLEPAQ